MYHLKNPGLVALACWATCSIALAQAPAVTLYGTVDGGVYSRQLAGESRLSRIDSGLMTTSRWGLRGTEDLGGGVSALFELSSHVRIDTGEYGRNPADTAANRMWSRLALVGVRGGFGQVRLGRIATGIWVNALSHNAFAESTALGPFLLHTFVGAQPQLTARGVSDGSWSNSIAYTTPSYGGFTGSVQWVPGEASADGRRLDTSVFYRSGSWSGGLSHSRVGGASYALPRRPTDPAGAPYTVTAERFTLGSIAYDFGPAHVFAQLADATLQPRGLPDISLRTVGLSAAIPAGAGRFLLGAAHSSRVQAAVSDRTRRTFSVGYDHILSKRTDIYGVVMRDSATGLSSGTGVAVGVRHHF